MPSCTHVHRVKTGRKRKFPTGAGAGGKDTGGLGPRRQSGGRAAGLPRREGLMSHMVFGCGRQFSTRPPWLDKEPGCPCLLPGA